MIKFCKTCNTEKSVSLFGNDKSKHDGLTYACKSCISEYKKKYDDLRRKDLGKEKRERASYGSNFSRNEKHKIYYHLNKSQVLEKQKKRRIENLEKYRNISRDYKRKNPEVILSLVAKRRAVHERATPTWANLFYIQEAYHIAKVRSEMTGVKHHVDHIVPLVSKFVCGLHVEHNLQVITAKANLRKGNRFDGDTAALHKTSLS